MIRIMVLLQFVTLLIFIFTSAGAQNRYETEKFVWNTPSQNSMGAMPAGNGDVGISLWVEENGDLLFYLSKTDAWSENGRLLKLGKVRLALSPNPFVAGNIFNQVLVLNDGTINIKAGEDKNSVEINCWVDANNPVVEFDVNSTKGINATCTFEPWRTQRRALKRGDEHHSAYGINGKDVPDIMVEKDSVLHTEGDNIVWLHRNKRSIWNANLSLQGLGSWTENHVDPLLTRTFGGLISSNKLKKSDDFNLRTSEPEKAFSVSIHALTQQTETTDEWIETIQQQAKNIELQNRDTRLVQHKTWWNEFWQRSYINVSSKNETESNKLGFVNQGYKLQRYMNACGGRGNSPIKFNGSIFTLDTKNLPGKYNGYDADYRRWGGPYWWQNTRLPYWSMLSAGDFDMMQVLFKMYREALPIRKEATKNYYNHKGAFFPETMYFWGTYVDANYGRDRSELPLGTTANRFIKYYWSGGLEVSLMMLDYYALTCDEDFLKNTLLPVVSEIITFFDEHWGRDESGKIRFEPAMALETYRVAVNPLPEIVGITKVCSELLNLPDEFISAELKEQYERIITEMPEVPVKNVDGKQVLIPAHEYSEKQNAENPELYAIFPYRTYGVGKTDLELARNTFAGRSHKETGGWQQNAIQAAHLGLAEEAADYVAANFSRWNKNYRFPAMWGPNYDWTPDQCHGSVAMAALQKMVMQTEGDTIYLLPAWPDNWDAEFKLHAPKNTVIEGKVENGEIVNMQITPKKREKDIVVLK